MEYRIFDTEQEAKDYSHSEAIMRGFGRDGDICQYWWAWRETIDGKWAVECPDGSKEEPIWKPQEVEDDN